MKEVLEMIGKYIMSSMDTIKISDLKRNVKYSDIEELTNLPKSVSFDNRPRDSRKHFVQCRHHFQVNQYNPTESGGKPF